VLTAVLLVQLGGSGKRWQRRTGDGDLSDPRRKKTVVTARQGARRRVAGWGRRRGCGGALGHVERPRGRQWPRLLRTAMTAALGHEMQSEREAAEEGIDTRKRRRGPGGCVAVLAGPVRRQK